MKTTFSPQILLTLLVANSYAAGLAIEDPCHAVRGGDRNKVKAMLRQNPKIVGERDRSRHTMIFEKYEGETPKDMALGEGHLEIAKLL